MNGLKFPRYTKLGSVNALMDRYKPAYFRELLELFRRSERDSDGVGEGEFHSEDALRKYLEVSDLTVTIHDTDKSKCLGC